MIYRATKEEIDDYFASPRIGQSRLKLLIDSVKLFNQYDDRQADLYYSEKEFFVIGSAVDCILTQSKEEFNKQYHVSTLSKKPSDAMMSMAHYIFDTNVRMAGADGTICELIAETDPEIVMAALNDQAYQTGWKPETRAAKVIEQAQEYYTSLIEAIGKQVISVSEHATIMSICHSLLANPKTRKYFQDEENVDLYLQCIIYWNYLGMEYKSMLDCLRVCHANKTVQVGDCKTMATYVQYFPSSLRTRRYDFQGVFYTMAVKQWIMDVHPEWADYTILNPAFIVETTKEGAQGEPAVFTMTDNLMAIGYNGINHMGIRTFGPDSGVQRYTSKRTKGVSEIIQLHAWHEENGYERDREIVEANSHFLLDWEGAVLV